MQYGDGVVVQLREHNNSARVIEQKQTAEEKSLSLAQLWDSLPTLKK